MPQPPARDSSRLRVLRLLADGVGVRRVARILGMTRQAVDKHALALEKEGAVCRVPHTNPRLYEPGPLLREVMENLVAHEGNQADRPGRSALQPSIRVDAGTWGWRVLGGPDREPPWSRRWVASGVSNARMSYAHGGVVYRVWERRGRDAVSLGIQPPPEWRPAASVTRAQTQRARACAQAMRAFAEEFGYRLQGALEEEQPTEYAMAAPGLAPAGRPGLDGAWVDESPGEGQSELESRSAEVVAAVARLPGTLAESDRRFAAIEARLSGVEAVQSRGLAVLERLARLHEREEVAHSLLAAVALPKPPPLDPGAPEVA
jgi:DNA-binding transcriptional ArsR family regulator